MIVYYMFMSLKFINCQIYTLDEEIEQNKNYNYGQEHFGDLSGLNFTFQFFIKQNSLIQQSYIGSIIKDTTPILQLYQKGIGFISKINQNSKTTINRNPFNENNWILIQITQTYIYQSDYQIWSYSKHQINFTNEIRFSLFADQGKYWQGQACCVFMYKGIDAHRYWFGQDKYILNNIKQPIAIVNLNFKENRKPSMDYDKNDYPYKINLEDQSINDGSDMSQQVGLQLKNAQFLRINNFSLNNQSTFEFMYKIQDQFTYNIVLLNYSFLDQSNQIQYIYVFQNVSVIDIKFNGFTQNFQLNTTYIIQFWIAIIQSMIDTTYSYKIMFHQFYDQQLFSQYSKQFTGNINLISNGTLQIGSDKSNLFISNKINLKIIRNQKYIILDIIKDIFLMTNLLSILNVKYSLMIDVFYNAILDMFNQIQENVRCIFPCLSCNGLSERNCTSCDIDRDLFDNQCQCKSGLYQDSSSECQKCLPQCTECIDNKSCSKCSYMRNLDSANKLCICQDGYYEDQSNCLKCQINCLKCINDKECNSCMVNNDLVIGLCQCKKGYFNDENDKCVSCQNQQGYLHSNCKNGKCGDAIFTSNEECDDGNNIDRDGCSNCTIDQGYKCNNKLQQQSTCYKCPENCINCTLKNNINICLQCKEGYFIKQKKCSQCNDNCLTCESQIQCIKCLILNSQPDQNGQCPKCEYGLSLQNGECKSICGDGIKSFDEECDLGSQNGLEGCAQSCTQQYGYSCTNNICTKDPIPPIQAYYANSTSKTQIQIQTQFNITQEYCNRIAIAIDDFNLDEFNFTILIQQDQCFLTFNYNKSISETNLIRIRIPIFLSRLLQDQVREIVIKPRRCVYNSEAQVKQAQNVQNAQNQFTFLIYIFGPLAAILGGFKNFMTILDILSWINNLYYINIEFPLNVQMIFQNTIWDSIIYKLFINLQIFSKVQQFNQPTDPYYKESPPHFMEKGTDPLFINNAFQAYGILILFALILVFAYVFIMICGKNSKKLRKINQNQKNIDIIQQIPEQKIIRNKLIQKLILYCELITKYKLQFLIKILNLIYLDLVMAIVLQLYCFQLNQIQDKIILLCYTLCYLSILLCASLIYISYFVSQQNLILIQNKTFTQNYGTLYERININSQAGMNYSFINLIRKTLYIIALVVFYQYPIFQTATCSFISSINVGLIIYENPFQSKTSLIQIGIPDFCIFFLMILFTILAIDDKVVYFSDYQRFLMGWVVIGVLLISISVQLYFILIQVLLHLKKRILYVWDKLIQLFKR